MKELPITMEHPDNWMEKTGGYAKDMTLRDYFAVKAMQAILSSDKYGGIIGVNTYEQRCAADAYKAADAMLKVGK